MNYHIDVQDLDVVTYQLIVQKKIPGMLMMTVDHNGVITYEQTGMVSLKYYLEKNQRDNVRIELIQQISFLLMCMESYFIKVENIELNEKYVFVDEMTGKVYLAYYPSVKKQETDALLDRMRVLFDRILSIETDDYVQIHKENICQDITSYHETTLFIPDQEEKQVGRTVMFEPLQEAAEKSKIRIARRKQGIYSAEIAEPYLLRNATGEQIRIHGNIFKIGKDKDYVDYYISDNPAISKSHADILKRDREYYIVDNHSLNTTKVNGEIIIPGKMVLLEEGCTISLANEQFTFMMKR